MTVKLFSFSTKSFQQDTSLVAHSSVISSLLVPIASFLFTMSALSASSGSINLASLYERTTGRLAPSLTSMLFPISPASNATSSQSPAMRYATHFSDDSDRSDSSSPQEAESMSLPLSLVRKTSSTASNEALYGTRNTSVIVSPLKVSNSKYQQVTHYIVHII